jgi:hypothetical protein
MDGLWAVCFAWRRLGFLDVRKKRILDEQGRIMRRKV